MTDNRHQRLRRAMPIAALAAVAFAIGAIVGSVGSGEPDAELARSFVKEWTRGDFAAMYAQLGPASRHGITPSAFGAAYEEALRTATADGAAVIGSARSLGGGSFSVPVRVQTRLWGPLTLGYVISTDSSEEGSSVRWTRSDVFPGLAAGQVLSRRTVLPRRATLLARDGTVLAESPPEGQSRSSPLGLLGTAVVGEVGPMPSSRRMALEAEGVPAEGQVGISGLELALDGRLRGRPGGELLAGSRVLAYAAPHADPPVRTSVSPAVQQAAVTALGGQLGGVVALQPSTGQVLAVAGIGLDGLQPPGSTFKMVTVSGVLSAGIAKPSTVFPYATYATLDGVRLNNANGEECGGSLELAFAVSCNSVFSPLGVKLGASRLVAMAEGFGFNHDPGLPGASESTIPPASQIQGELDVGSTAIGQGQVLATPLQMATVAATIGEEGQRPTPSFSAEAPSPRRQVLSASVARTVRHLMIQVVQEGTGTAAAIPGVTVAGKTGTAELKTCSTGGESSTAREGEEGESPPEGCGKESEASNTDAWFAAFAPAGDPRVAVCVMLVKDGAGGATAAPVAKEVLEAALHAHL